MESRHHIRFKICIGEVAIVGTGFKPKSSRLKILFIVLWLKQLADTSTRPRTINFFTMCLCFCLQWVENSECFCCLKIAVDQGSGKRKLYETETGLKILLLFFFKSEDLKLFRHKSSDLRQFHRGNYRGGLHIYCAIDDYIFWGRYFPCRAFLPTRY